MRQFDYAITRHPAEAFRNLVYFCSEGGECNMQEIPSDQIRVLEGILNDQGRQGWELVHVSFGKDGVLVFWKRMINEGNENRRIERTGDL